MLHVDGSRDDKENAGWGWSLRGPGEITLAEGSGPVVTIPGPGFLGAVEPSNMAGEASAVIQGLQFISQPDKVQKLRDQGLQDVLHVNVDQRIGLQMAEGLWWLKTEPGLMLQLIKADEAVKDQGIKIVLHWKRSHQINALETAAGRGNAGADHLAGIGRLRERAFQGTGALHFQEDPKQDHVTVVTAIDRPPDDYVGETDPGENQASSPSDQSDQHLASLARRDWRIHRRLVKDTRFRNYVLLMLTGAHWCSGEPLRKANDKLTKFDANLDLDNWRKLSTTIQRDKLQPRLLWARVQVVMNMWVTDRRISAGARRAQQDTHKRAIAEHAKLQAHLEGMKLRRRIPKGVKRPATRSTPWVRIRLKSKQTPKIVKGRDIKGWTTTPPPPPEPLQMKKCKYGCPDAEDSIQHYLGIGLLLNGDRAGPNPCPAWCSFVADQHPDRDADAPPIDHQWFLGHSSSKDERTKGLEALHALRAIGWTGNVGEHADHIIPSGDQQDGRRKRTGRIALGLTRDPSGCKLPVTAEQKERAKAVLKHKNIVREHLKEAAEQAKRSLTPVAFNFYGPLDHLGRWEPLFTRHTYKKSSIKIIPIPGEEVELPAPPQGYQGTADQRWTERIQIIGMAGDVRPLFEAV